MRTAGRPNDELRPVRVTRGFTKTPAGSVLWQQGDTVLLCTASVSRDLPPWMKDDRAGGWVTCEYVMLPGSTPNRKPWPKIGHTDGRGTEIQRLIGRSLRAAVDLSKIGPHTIALDCQVLQADGGTRTAAVCGAWVALADALASLPAEMPGALHRPRPTMGDGPDAGYGPVPARRDSAYYDPAGALVEQVAAVSVGVVDGEVRLDLDYADDSRADVDLNLAMTANGRFVEIQGSSEQGAGFDSARLTEMLALGTLGCQQLLATQRAAREAIAK
ncbi:MAG: rph [Phycisphaerales bacterium]|nr:rph [Phycisphaerales bacterium]